MQYTRFQEWTHRSFLRTTFVPSCLRGKAKYLCILIAVALVPTMLLAQVNSVEFGKNRLQFKKNKWKFYQSRNFNTYFTEDGIGLGKFVIQAAEEELPSIENEVEYNLQRRANFVVCNTYDDYKSSNIGIGIDWQIPGGLTKLVNNKIVLYYDGNHANLRRQVREGIARVLVDNLLFGDDAGEIAGNQALLDLPLWMTDGYVEYVAEHWSTQKDDALKSAIGSGRYNTFYQLAYEQPLLAGHAFWYYMAEKYKPESVSYFIYLAKVYKSINSASEKICKKKIKVLLDEFMQHQQQYYSEDIRQRRNAPKGRLSVVEEVSHNKDYYHFAANPNPRNNSYAVVQFNKGVYSVKYVNDQYEDVALLSYGVRTHLGDINPNYPIVAWDGKGTKLLVLYWKEGRIQMFIYDAVARLKRYKQEIKGFEQILSANFMLDDNTLLLSATKKGQSDIFIYKINNEKITQVTNDSYDDLDAGLVSFPNRTGVIFSSDRTGSEKKEDTVFAKRYNIFIVDLDNKSEFKQIVKLTDMKYGNARYPMQYNTNHFTFVSDENGIGNRWAGFFSTSRSGLDTLYYFDNDVFRNLSSKEMDSTLRALKKEKPDSVSYFQVYQDSTYTFPITNYQSSLLETRIAGDKGQVSEVRREGDAKYLYKLRVDSIALRKRNINAKPTMYMQKQMRDARVSSGDAIAKADVTKKKTDTTSKQAIFQSEFTDDRPDSLKAARALEEKQALAAIESKKLVAKQSNLFDYKLKFNADYVLTGFSNNILINRYQPYNGGTGPVQSNNSVVNFTFRAGAGELMEDLKIMGGVRLGSNLNDKDVFITFQNLRRRIDWGVSYYRSNQDNFPNFFKGDLALFENKLFTGIYQANASYPLNEVKSIKANFGYRTDKGVIRPTASLQGGGLLVFPENLRVPDSTAKTLLAKLEYVHDNTINPTQNIWNGLRWKTYIDFTLPIGKGSSIKGKKILNIGFDARYYVQIYRNFIWAGRAAGDASFGDHKMIYYLGGADGWLWPKFDNNNRPDPTQNYAFQSLALNLRGFKQNIANGSKAVVLNSEFRLPIFSTFFNKPINNAFIRNLQLIQFVDAGTAWNESFSFKRPILTYKDNDQNSPVTVRVKSPGIGPFMAGYGFGARSTLLGYFMKLDAGWPMVGFFKGKPSWYFAIGLDF